jgi:hypothetical protein
MLTLYNEFGSIPPLSILSNSLSSIGLGSLNVYRIQPWICVVLGLPFLRELLL